MRRQLRYLLLLAALFALAPGWTQAAEITVDADGVCTLADAIRSANRNQDLNGCVGEEEPYGDDIIILETDVELESGHAERPPIMSYYETSTGDCNVSGSVTIEGQGYTIDGKDGDGYVLKVSRSMYEELEEYECNYGGVLTVNNAMITGGNHAASSTDANMPGNGGGLVNAYSGELTLNNVTVNGNTAAGDGGGIFSCPNCQLTLNNSTISGNSTVGDGGGVYMDIYPAAGNSTLNHVTITGNIAEGLGGGIYMSKYPMGGTVALKSSVVISNTVLTSDGGNEIFCSGSFTSDSDFNLFGHSGENNADAFTGFTPGSSDITATSDGTEPTVLSDILSPLADNGGPTKTHALVAGSPAIDLDADCSTELTTDQRGYPRPETESAGCDAGSFEYSNNCTSNIIVDADGVCTLADAITAANTNAPSGGCPAGCDNDTITLETDVLLATALPQISSTVTIEGQGYAIDGNNDPNVGSVLRNGVNGNLILNEVTVTKGKSFAGGGINNEGVLALINSTVKNNSVSCLDSATDAFGGGITNTKSLTMTNSTVSDNFVFCDQEGAHTYGGGIVNDGDEATATLNNSKVMGNSVVNNAGGAITFGGGIVNGGITNGTLTLNASIVNGNSVLSKSYAAGGGIANFEDNGTVTVLTLNNSTVSGNSTLPDPNWSEGDIFWSMSSGGGIANWGTMQEGPVAVLNNSTITDNSAKDIGGGIENVGGTVVLRGSILSGNNTTQSDDSNEIYNAESYDKGTVTANNYNLLGQSGETNTEAFDGFTPGSTDLTAISDGTNPTALSDILSPLADNGGPTLTHALVTGSPALDLDADCSTGLTEDQRGYPRPETEGTGCDAGAFEGSVSSNKAFLPAIYLLLFNK